MHEWLLKGWCLGFCICFLGLIVGIVSLTVTMKPSKWLCKQVLNCFFGGVGIKYMKDESGQFIEIKRENTLKRP